MKIITHQQYEELYEEFQIHAAESGFDREYNTDSDWLIEEHSFICKKLGVEDFDLC